MPTLSITKTYQDGEVLFEADLDNIKNDIETFINITKIDDSNIQDSGITASTKIIDASITSGKIASAAITTVKIADSNVTTAKIADSNVTTAKIADSNVTTAKISDSAVTTAKIADGAVTYAKRAALNYSISSSCGSFSTTSASAVDITNLSVSITTTGKPVFISLVPDGSSAANFSGQTGATATLSYVVGASTVASSSGSATASTLTFSGCGLNFPFIHPIVAGTYTIKAQASISGGATLGINNYKILVYEL